MRNKISIPALFLEPVLRAVKPFVREYIGEIRGAFNDRWEQLAVAGFYKYFKKLPREPNYR